MTHDADDLTGEDRLRGVARILAAGVLRLHRRAALKAPAAPENLANSAAPGLELPPEVRLSGSRRVDEV